ncbi:MAG: carbohydrate ABC transporter permease, partial [Caldilineaceae bacterium]|nr:carbohydrate ABC transporter permease [Caldilineaceae bacterium]
MTSSVDTSAEHTLQMAEQLVGTPQRKRRRLAWATVLAYIPLSIGAVAMIVPFLWMLLTSLKPAPELLGFAFLPEHPTLDNYVRVLSTSSFGLWYFNSLLVATFSTFCVAIFDSLVGYTINKFEFPGKNLIFLGILATLMI